MALQNEYVKHIDLSKERINLIQKQLRVLEAIRERKLSGLLKSNDYNNLLDVEMLLALGSRVALSAGPPSGWTEKSPLYAHRPPFPTEDIMRCSSLFRFMNTPNQEAPLQHTIEVNEMQTSVGLGKSSPQKRTEKKKTKDSEESDNEMLMLDLNPDMI